MGDDTPGKITASRNGRTGSVSVSAIECSSRGAVGTGLHCAALVPAATGPTGGKSEKIPLPPRARREDDHAGHHRHEPTTSHRRECAAAFTSFIRREHHAMTREEAWQLVRDNVQAVRLRRHTLSAAAAMRAYAAKLGGDVEQWGLAGLLHDWDGEIHPTLETHVVEGTPILREKGVPEPVLQAILSHNEAATGVRRREPIDFALLANYEVTGLIIAAAFVRPSKNVGDVELKSIKKRWKERIFAAGVDRDHVEKVTAELGAACFGGQLDLWDHVGNVLAAMQGIAAELELDRRVAGGPAPGA